MQKEIKVTPDLATFGKAIANGMPLSVVAGKKKLMQGMKEIFFSTTFGKEILWLLFVIFFDKSWPATNELFKVSSNVKTPLAAPKVVSFCLDVPGMKASISSLNLVLFPDCEAKWIVGVQKPETHMQSHLISVSYTHLTLPTNREV